MIDSKEEEIFPVLFRNINNQEWAIGVAHKSSIKYIEAMRMFGRTDYEQRLISVFFSKRTKTIWGKRQW